MNVIEKVELNKILLLVKCVFLIFGFRKYLFLLLKRHISNF